ncbi:hypothetical protein BST61_g3305 [Cercospora zeina]
MWSRSLRRPLPKPCRAHASVNPPSYTRFARSLDENAIRNIAPDDGHDTISPVGNDNSPPLKTSSSLLQLHQLRIDPPYDDMALQPPQIKLKTSYSWLTFNFSKAARAIAGVDRFCFRFHHVHIPGPDSVAQRIQWARDLDHQIQQLPASGLGNLAAAVRAIEKTLPPDQCMVLSLRKNSFEVACKHRFPSDHALRIRVFLKRLVRHGTPTRRASVEILASYNEEEAAQSHANLTSLETDVTHLDRTAHMVMERIVNAMKFDSPEAFAKTIAESLLRILRFRTPYLDITGITLKSFPSHGEKGPCRPFIRIKAGWKGTAGGVPAECDRLSHPIELVVEEASTDISIAEQDPDDVQGPSSNAADLETPNSDPARKGVPPCGSGPKPLLTKDRTDLLAASMPIQSESLRRFGMSKYKFQLRWPAALGPALSRLSLDFCVNAAERAIADTPGDGLATLYLAAQNFQRSLPFNSSVVLHVYGTRKDQTRGSLLSFRHASSRPANFWSFSNAGIPLPPVRIADSKSEEPFETAVTLVFGETPTASLSNHDRLEQQCTDTILAVKKLLTQVLGRGPHNSWMQLADNFAEALCDMKPPLVGCSSIHHVIVKLYTPSRRGKVQRATSRAPQKTSQVMIALGSNVGERVENIEAACQRIDADPDITIGPTSALYPTKAMYVEEQAAFLNGMCSVRTSLSPVQLLDRLQQIEKDLGRVKLIDKGPRNIDLDIVTYSRACVDSDRLCIPHKLMLEREFVLRPFCDITGIHRHPRTGKMTRDHLKELTGGKSTMYPLTPLAPGCESLRSLEPTRHTLVMSILNVTPDSFSDGGSNEPTNLDALRETIAAQISAGATIIDIGGQSSRPNAQDVTAEEELARILPAIEVIKAMPEAKHIAISIDTYRASVAEAAINAGAHIVNDISAGLLDAEMLPTIARLGCTYVMMHMRGTPATMQSAENTSYPRGLIPTIATELATRLRAAQRAGIRRWRIILDPGVGFAKTAEQNAELLGRFAKLRNFETLKTYPWLVGSSRKGFIGEFTGAEDPKDRVAGTAATVTAAVAGGAEIVRVHDVHEMSRVVKMADAMYRRAPSGPVAVEEAENGDQQKATIEERDEGMDDEEAEGAEEEAYEGEEEAEEGEVEAEEGEKKTQAEEGGEEERK